MTLGLTSRIVLTFALLAALLTATIGATAYRSGRVGIEAASTAQVLAVAVEKEAAVDAELGERLDDIRQAATSGDLVQNVTILVAATPLSKEARSAHALVLQGLAQHTSDASAAFVELSVIEPESGTVLVSTSPAEEHTSKIRRPYFTKGKTALSLQGPYRSAHLKIPAMVISAPVYSGEGHAPAVLAARLNLAAVNTIVGRRDVRHQTADAFLFNKERMLVTQPRFLSESAVLQRKLDSEFVNRCVTTGEAEEMAPDYRGVQAISACRWMPKYDLGLVVSLGRSEAFASVGQFQWAIGQIGLLTLFASAGLAWTLARRVTRPISRLNDGVRRFAEGRFREPIPESSADEIGLVAREFNKMARDIDAKSAALRQVTADLDARVQQRTAALTLSEARLIQAQELAEAGSWEWDVVNGDVVWSDESFRIFGFAPGGCTPSYEQYLACIHPDDRLRTAAWIAGVLEQKTSARLDNRIVRPDGEVRSVRGRADVSLDDSGQVVRVFGTVQDATKDKAREDELLLFRTILDQSSDAILVTDSTTARILDASGAACLTLGYTRDELLALSVPDFETTIDGLEDFKQKSQQLKSAGGSRAEGRQRRKDGSTFPVELSVAFIAHPEGDRVLTIARDITERKGFEAALLQARDAADVANRAKSEFLANMSHEIRTPMNGVIGMTDLLSDTVLEPVQREYVDVIKISADALMSVIEEILDFSKIEAGMLQIDPITVEVGQVFGDAVKALALQAHQKGLELVYHMAPGVPEYIVADPLRLRQVVTNLLSNAIKFTERGEVALDVDAEPCEGGDLTLHIRVRDTGIGIARDTQERIFLPFEQADGSTTRQHGGTGLGLTISSRLANLMRGRIWVESEEGRGSTFHFTARVTPGIGIPSHTAEDAVLAGLRVLIIDDNATNRFVLQEMVQRWGMRPTTADGGERGLAALRESRLQDDPYQVVLLDSHMPDIDGFMVAERMRENPGLRDVTVLMLTSAERSSDVRRCRQLGLAAYLVKPVTQKELRTTVVRVLSGTPALTQSERDTIAASDRPLRILLAEDNVVNQKVAVALLSQFHHEVTVTPNGQAAVDAYRRQPFDLILMDVQMPVLDGFAATRAIRQIERATGTHTPIVAMTARAMKGDRERCLDAGMDDYLSKPVQGARVIEVIRRVLGPSPVPPDEPEPAEEVEPVASAPAGALGPAVLTRLRTLAQATTPALFADVLTVFQTDAAAYVFALQDAAAADDRERLARTAHALKGASLTVGATTMADTCRQLETVEETGSLVAVPSLLAQLESEFKRVKAEIERELDQEQVHENTHR